MTRYVAAPMLVLSLCGFLRPSLLQPVFPDAPAQSLFGDRILLGTVAQMPGSRHELIPEKCSPAIFQ